MTNAAKRNDNGANGNLSEANGGRSLANGDVSEPHGIDNAMGVVISEHCGGNNGSNRIINRIINQNTFIMANKDYVPRTHSGFKSWQQTVLQFVTANAAAWGIDAQTVTDFTTDSATFVTLYDSVDNRNTRTLQQVTAFNQFRISYTAFLRQLVQGSLVNNPLVAYDDKIAMGLNVRSGSRSNRPAIYTVPELAVSGVGAGVMEFTCKDSADGRSKMPDNADGVILVVTLIMGKTTDTNTGEIIDITEQVTIPSSKTRVRYAFNDSQRGKPFSVVGKWYNNTDHSKDGQFGNAVSGFIG